ncbi:hypothetical protein [Capnocytophaga leadbetteri]|uniref:hypothetical protein n=1 Tax=Capnocytophaga leadbetteri TaxID=327575 RepID=UPI0028E27D1A|nr:hypothetical protein [Capnocytophaga leadbetteri]
MKNKGFKVGFLLLVAGLISCDGSQQTSDNTPTEHKVKSVDFEELKLTDLSPKAHEDLRQWKNFQSLMQIIISMAPNKIKNTDALALSNPDSLLIYNRLHPISSKTENVNALVERDWRTPPNSTKDTVFRVEKIKEDGKAFLQWRRFLIANIPYTFSVSSKKINYSLLNLVFSEEGKEELSTQLVLDTLSTLPANVKRRTLVDDWNEFEVVFSPKKTGTYNIQLSLDEEAKANDNVILYRPVLELAAKNFQKVSQYSDKIIGENSKVESSYYSVYFWLTQMQDALRDLLTDSFPERIDIPSIKVRFRLFQTQIKSLADNVKNNPDFKEETLKNNINLLGENFNSIISHINKVYNNDLDERMRYIDTNNE